MICACEEAQWANIYLNFKGFLSEVLSWTLSTIMAALGTALLLSLVSGCFAAKFVMFPMFGRSHYMILNKLGQELSERGHEVFGPAFVVVN